MDVIVNPTDGATYYVVKWYGFSPNMNDLVRQHGYAGVIDWWNKEVSPWLYARQNPWYWIGHGQGEDGIVTGINGYAFRSKDDALLFKLTWHVDQHNPKMPPICSGKRSVP